MSDASYRAGVSAVLMAADEAAAAIRARPNADGIRQRAAAEALEAFSQAFRSEAARTTKRRQGRSASNLRRDERRRRDRVSRVCRPAAVDDVGRSYLFRASDRRKAS